MTRSLRFAVSLAIGLALAVVLAPPSQATGYQNGAFTCRLGSGDALPGVFVLQAALAQCFAKIKVDGIYGIETENSVRFLQYLTGITVDGTYGPETRGVMTWPWLFPNNQFHKCDVL